MTAQQIKVSEWEAAVSEWTRQIKRLETVRGLGMVGVSREVIEEDLIDARNMLAFAEAQLENERDWAAFDDAAAGR